MPESTAGSRPPLPVKAASLWFSSYGFGKPDLEGSISASYVEPAGVPWTWDHSPFVGQVPSAHERDIPLQLGVQGRMGWRPQQAAHLAFPLQQG